MVPVPDYNIANLNLRENNMEISYNTQHLNEGLEAIDSMSRLQHENEDKSKERVVNIKKKLKVEIKPSGFGREDKAINSANDNDFNIKRGMTSEIKGPGTMKKQSQTGADNKFNKNVFIFDEKEKVKDKEEEEKEKKEVVEEEKGNESSSEEEEEEYDENEPEPPRLPTEEFEKIDYEKYADSDDESEIQIGMTSCEYFRQNLLNRHVYLSSFIKTNVFNQRAYKLTALCTLLFVNLILNAFFYTYDYSFKLVRIFIIVGKLKRVEKYWLLPPI